MLVSGTEKLTLSSDKNHQACLMTVFMFPNSGPSPYQQGVNKWFSKSTALQLTHAQTDGRGRGSESVLTLTSKVGLAAWSGKYLLL